MPFARHIRLTASGTIGVGSGVEQFQYGLNLSWAQVNNLPNWNDDNIWVDMAADVAAFHGRAATRIWSNARLREVKFAQINEQGIYTTDPRIIAFTVPVDGGVAAQTAAETPQPQEALAVSLNTAQRGARGRGRFYIPCPVVNVDGVTMLIDQGVADGLAGSAQMLLNNLNNHQGVDAPGSPEVVVASSFGANYVVNGVRVGRVVDTIRSRRRSIPEAYSAELPVS